MDVVQGTGNCGLHLCFVTVGLCAFLYHVVVGPSIFFFTENTIEVLVSELYNFVVSHASETLKGTNKLGASSTNPGSNTISVLFRHALNVMFPDHWSGRSEPMTRTLRNTDMYCAVHWYGSGARRSAVG